MYPLSAELPPVNSKESLPDSRSHRSIPALLHGNFMKETTMQWSETQLSKQWWSISVPFGHQFQCQTQAVPIRWSIWKTTKKSIGQKRKQDINSLIWSTPWKKSESGVLLILTRDFWCQVPSYSAHWPHIRELMWMSIDTKKLHTRERREM